MTRWEKKKTAKHVSWQIGAVSANYLENVPVHFSVTTTQPSKPSFQWHPEPFSLHTDSERFTCFAEQRKCRRLHFYIVSTVTISCPLLSCFVSILSI